MQHITGLTVKTAELLQVWLVPGTLGIGGKVYFWLAGLPRARPREACPTNCMIAQCCEHGATSHWEVRINNAHRHSAVSIQQISAEYHLCAQVSY